MAFYPQEIRTYESPSALWAAWVENRTLESVFIDVPEAKRWLSNRIGFQIVHVVEGYAHGAAYSCHPEYRDLVVALDQGLQAHKRTDQYNEACAKYDSVFCDTTAANFSNVKTQDRPEIADHLSVRADIVIGTEAEWGEHNYMENGVVGGFAIDLTYSICQLLGLACAIVPVPWQSLRNPPTTTPQPPPPPPSFDR